ncbi:hypothetical protein PC129_g13643 [Phytophthora cactorum]|uniref:Uncharacterized protein n=1 Tax=Phytophthora cactorum TaxID=29920 RepID=A0A8T1K7H4_9STRA|nr:hypothetical protein PC114_g17255 [Phytophthora cactorum]KAG2920276.1 hypothetical protein PC117_g16566 [Phytophthora cactorum]KAG3006271.1 hypothetical protein PC119_g15036 [Phytophthora cactorum]KAG3147965.1 hypothetical protein C6341_g17568 [Phytophthora cactorum]KAG3215468.1 hypothetical protein PC129_g13643 [Phytophthora cactorum]
MKSSLWRVRTLDVQSHGGGNTILPDGDVIACEEVEVD